MMRSAAAAPAEHVIDRGGERGTLVIAQRVPPDPPALQVFRQTAPPLRGHRGIERQQVERVSALGRDPPDTRRPGCGRVGRRATGSRCTAREGTRSSVTSSRAAGRPPASAASTARGRGCVRRASCSASTGRALPARGVALTRASGAPSVEPRYGARSSRNQRSSGTPKPRLARPRISAGSRSATAALSTRLSDSPRSFERGCKRDA